MLRGNIFFLDFIEIPQNSLDLDHDSEPNGTTNNVEITNSKEKNESILEISGQTEQLNPSGTFLSVFPNDPGKLLLVLSNELVHHFSSLGPCQSIALELLNYEFPKKKYANGDVTIDSHESWSEHITSEIARSLYQKNMRIDTGILEAANPQIAENRAVMSAIIEAILFIAKQNIALRGHDEGYKSSNLKQAKKIAVIIDTTTDISNIEQYTFILRYISEQGKVNERLVAPETVPDSTGLAQAYDGATSIQGQYSGLKTRIQEENPSAIYVWCSAHIFNLVVVDTCDYCLETKLFFGNISSLVEFIKSLSKLLNGHELKFNYSTPNDKNSHISSDDSPSLLSTIPISSASVECSFSKVKLIKNRLRSSTGQSRLESLLILSTEKDIPTDINSVIDQVALSSDIFKKN
ncbi:hypothetical protein AGLY_012931 [Aphis glycines]|uniref:DUF4371 domain-containing protein n=1 Tax=Aphis glycines TaxID=307491 RepID=A0A6G0T7L0_APHGL|nr:hypothetical protein AGLY_012931 [Aphis glycines]